MSGSQNSQSTFRFQVVRSFKAFDDGARKKFVLTAHARNLPLALPLEANARLPNIIRNKTCAEMRKTLLTKPENFPILNGGIVCTASSFEVKQEGNEHVVEIGFDEQGGIVNGGHTYGQLVHLLLGDNSYSHDKDLEAVLALDADDDDGIKDLLADSTRLAAAITRAREKAQVQVEVIFPVNDQDLVVEISTARNRSLPVEETGFQNLAGRFDPMKEVLRTAAAPFGPSFVDKIVWKPNQEVPEDSRAVPVKSLIHLMALMNVARYPSDTPANDVYMRSGLVIREFGDPSEEEERVYAGLVKLLPELIRLYEHIYVGLPEVNQTFPWADGKKEEGEKAKRKRAAFTPFLQKPVATKVAVPFLWPIFASFRCLLTWAADGSLAFKVDPVDLFEEMKAQLATAVISFFNRAKVVGQVGRDKEVWVRLDGLVAGELVVQERVKALANRPRRP